MKNGKNYLLVFSLKISIDIRKTNFPRRQEHTWISPVKNVRQVDINTFASPILFDKYWLVEFSTELLLVSFIIELKYFPSNLTKHDRVINEVIANVP